MMLGAPLMGDETPVVVSFRLSRIKLGMERGLYLGSG